MFQDLEYKKTEFEQIQELQKWKDGATDLLREGKAEIERLEKEALIMDRKFNNSYQDARRMAGILTKEIKKDRLDELMSEQADIEKILEDANILDD